MQCNGMRGTYAYAAHSQRLISRMNARASLLRSPGALCVSTL